MAFPVTLNGRTYTLADFSGTNYVDGFPDALEDFVTQAGDIYNSTSTTSNTIGTGSKTFTVEAAKPYQAGTPLRIADAAAPATNFMDAIVTSYSGTSLVVNVFGFAGSGTYTSWTVNIGGAKTIDGILSIAQGGTGAATAADARTNLDTYSKAEADSRFLNVSGEASNVTMTGNVTIGDAGTDTLTINAEVLSDSFVLSNAANTEFLLRAFANGATELYYDNGLKLATTSTGVDVTGTVTADGVTADTADINGGTIDGTVIGGSTPAAISGTTGTFSGNLTISGSARRIFGDMSDATHANRLSFQTSVTDGATSPFFIPNGTGNIASVVVANASDPTNSSYGQLVVDGTNDVRVTSGVLGTGTALPMTFFTGGGERLRIATDGKVGVATSTPAAPLQVNDSATTSVGATAGDFTEQFRIYGTNGNATHISQYTVRESNGTDWTTSGNRLQTRVDTTYMGWMQFNQNGAIAGISFGTGTDTSSPLNVPERMRIDGSGNVGIGTSSPAAQLHVQNPSGNSTSILGQFGTGTRAEITAASNEVVFKAYNGTNDVMTFYTGASERARIDASGNLLVGTTTGGHKLLVADPTGRTEADAQIRVVGSGYSFYTFLDANACHLGQNSNSRSFRIYSGSNPAVGVDLAAGGTSWGTYSDERTKTALKPIEGALDKVSSLRAVTGRYLTDEETVSRSFLIAQDVQAVLPEAVDVGTDENKTLLLKYTEVMPLLVAAIKEQQDIIEALEARITALEAQP